MDSEAPSTPRELLESLLAQGMVMVTLDARREEVQVPSQFTQDPQLRLNLSYRFGLPIELDEWGVRARLTFSGVPFDCALPWDAIYMVVSHVTGQPLLFPENVPHELMQLASQMRARATGNTPEGKQRPQLKVVTPGAEEPAAEETGEAEAEAAAELEAPEAAAETQVAGESEPTDAPEETSEGPPRTPPRRGHLRVVK